MKIAYALSGVGRGHTMRASALGTMLLENGYEVIFFSCCDAIETLTKKFGQSRVREMPTPQFSYDDSGLNVWKTSWNYGKFMVQERKTIIELGQMLKVNGFDAVITDYEPLLSRAANHVGIPLISFNSQGFVDICSIPLKYKTLSLQVALVNAFIRAEPQYSIVSKPVNLPTKSQLGCIVGPMIRPHIKNKRWMGRGNHILVYMRDSISSTLPSIVKWSQDNGLNVYVYGEVNDKYENYFESPMVIKKPISETQFIADMLTSQVVISTAGTQIIGEVAYVGAPTILIPEKGQREQELNAYLASDAYPNIGMLHMEKVNSIGLRDVFNTLSGFGGKYTEDGSAQAFSIFERWAKNL